MTDRPVTTLIKPIITCQVGIWEITRIGVGGLCTPGAGWCGENLSGGDKPHPYIKSLFPAVGAGFIPALISPGTIPGAIINSQLLSSRGAKQRSDLCNKEEAPPKHPTRSRANPPRHLLSAIAVMARSGGGKGQGRQRMPSRRDVAIFRFPRHACADQTRPNRPPRGAPLPPGGSRRSPRRIFSKILLAMTTITGLEYCFAARWLATTKSLGRG